MHLSEFVKKVRSGTIRSEKRRTRLLQLGVSLENKYLCRNQFKIMLLNFVKDGFEFVKDGFEK